MATTIAAAATALLHFFRARHAAEFERLGDILVHSFLNLMEILLRFHETGRDWICHQHVAVFFVIGDFFWRQTHTLLLLVLKMFAFFGEIAIERFGAVIGEERVDLAAQSLVTRILQDRFAKFSGFLVD